MILIMNDENYRDKISLDDLYHRTQEVEDLRLRVYKKILNYLSNLTNQNGHSFL